jgi:hypothetical protein
MLRYYDEPDRMTLDWDEGVQLVKLEVRQFARRIEGKVLARISDGYRRNDEFLGLQSAKDEVCLAALTVAAEGDYWQPDATVNDYVSAAVQVHEWYVSERDRIESQLTGRAKSAARIRLAGHAMERLTKAHRDYLDATEQDTPRVS